MVEDNLVVFGIDVVSDIRVNRVVGDSFCLGSFRPAEMGVDKDLLGGVNCDLIKNEGDVVVDFVFDSFVLFVPTVDLLVRGFSIMLGEGSNCD
jgi:hypothetical protein